MATLSNTHEHNDTSSSSIPLEDAELGQPPRPVKGVKVVPMYHPRMGYLHILAYAACNLVSPLPTGASTVSDSEAQSIATPSPPTNWVPLPPVAHHKETFSSANGSTSESDGGFASVSTLTPPPVGARRLRSRDVRPPVQAPHPYKDSSYTLRSSRKTKPEVDISQTESSKQGRSTRQNQANSIASRRPKRKTYPQSMAT